MLCEGEKVKGVEHHGWCERAIEADAQGFAFRFIGTSRNIVGVARMRISAVPLELRYKQLASLGDEAGAKKP